MTITRTHFPIGPTDTGGTYSDTGFLFGAVRQIQWHPNDPGDTGTAFDTGGDLKIQLLSGIDTGAAVTILDDNDCLGTAFHRIPTQPMISADGSVDPADTGAAFGGPIYASGEKVRVTVTPGGRRVLGNLWITTEQ